MTVARAKPFVEQFGETADGQMADGCGGLEIGRDGRGPDELQGGADAFETAAEAR